MSQLQRRAARWVVVALHDVAPPFEDAIRAQLDLLAEIGIRRVTLLVTPDWHSAAPLRDAPGLVDLLQAHVAAGSQLALHGYAHQPDDARPFEGTRLDRLRARLFAANAAEFLTLDPQEAEDALRAGLDEFEQAGLPRPAMFCAPGWLHNAAAEAALTRAGLRYLIGMFDARDLWSGWRIQTPAVGYMGAGPKQELGVRILNLLVRLAKLRSAEVACVYLHPQGQPTGARVRSQIAYLSKLLARGWQPATYADIFDARSMTAASATQAIGAPISRDDPVDRDDPVGLLDGPDGARDDSADRLTTRVVAEPVSELDAESVAVLDAEPVIEADTNRTARPQTRRAS